MARDVALAVAVTVVGLVRDIRRFAPPVGDESPVRPYLLQTPPWTVIAAHLLGGLLILGRRRRPELTAILLGLLAVAVPVFAAVAMTYSVVRYGRRVPVAVALSGLLLLTSLWGADLLPLVGSFRWTDGDPYTLVLLAAALTALGLYRRAACDLRDAVAAQIAQVESEQRVRAENERLRERAALALELHDEVARHLSLLALTAAGSDDDLDDGMRRRQVLAHGREASEALYALIRALAGSPPALEPGTDSLVVGSAAAPVGPAALTALGQLDGVEIDPLDLSGHDDDDPAWPVLAAVAAEGVVNALRHAPGSSVRVGVMRAGGELRLTIINTAAVPGAAGSAGVESGAAASAAAVPRAAGSVLGLGSGAGLGLQSARNRCEALGGSLHVCADPDGGVRVVATVPAAAGQRR